MEGRERTVEVEILRAECKFLRMEREVALKKLERNRVQMERTLRSAVQTLVSVSISIPFPRHSVLVSEKAREMKANGILNL